MRYRLLDIIVCPDCGSGFDLQVFTEHKLTVNITLRTPGPSQCTSLCARYRNDVASITLDQCQVCYSADIWEGKLTCQKCRSEFPVINGVPRLLRKALLVESVMNYHRDFLHRHHEAFSSVTDTPTSEEKKKIDTLHAFSYQWTTYVNVFDYYKNMFSTFIHPFLTAVDFQDKLVLDVGCGSGRPASMVASYGAEVVGVDISESVEVVHALTERFTLVHVVQGDVYNLPFRPCFDLAISIGVIQHIPDPARAIRSIAHVVPAGRPFIAWVYAKRELWYRAIDLMRLITVKLPHRLLRLVSYFMGLISELLFLIPYRVMSRIPFTRSIAEKIPGRHYSHFPFRENVLGWFDRLGAPVTHYFTYQQVFSMLEKAEFEDIKILARPGASASWILKAIRKDTVADPQPEESSQA